MRSRILPAEEWPRLAGTEAATIWPLLNPAQSQVLVVEDGSEIVGCWILAPVLHAECLWIAPSYRRVGGVGRRLWKAMRAAVTAQGARGVITAAATDEIKGLLARVGAQPLPGEQFAMMFQEGSCLR